MSSKASHKRLMKEYAQIQASPPPFIIAKPLEKNVLEWYFVITGPPETPYHNGEYLGKLVFPPEYPFKAPNVQFLTPTGRFRCNTNICLSFSAFHPESWQPGWSVASMLTGTLSFMNENTSTTGSVDCSYEERQSLAKQSRQWNRNNQRFKEVFPELASQPAVIAGTSTSTEKPSNQPQVQQGDLLDREVAVPFKTILLCIAAIVALYAIILFK